MRIAMRRCLWPAAALAAAGALLACGGGAAPPQPDAATAPWRLRALDEPALAAYFRTALARPAVGGWPVPAVPTGLPGAAADGAATAFSGTTLQEAGVDEADLVKTDGVHVFSLDPAAPDEPWRARATLRRQRLDAGAADAALAPAGSLALPLASGTRGSGMYLDAEGGQIAVLAQAAGGPLVADAWFAPWAWSQGATEVLLVDTAPALQVRRTWRIAAHLVGSRRIAATLYLVLRSAPQPPGFDPWWGAASAAGNQRVLDGLQAAQVLPTVQVDGGAPQPLVQPASCLAQEQNAVRTPDVITVVAIDLASGRHAARCFAGGTEALYLSPRHLYLATTRTGYAGDARVASYPGTASTDIHKFALDGLAIDYRGSGNVAGHLGFDQNRKSFRFGEHEGVLRVFTQTDAAWGPVPLPPGPGIPAPGVPASAAAPATAASAPSPGRLTLLAERAGSLSTVGELPNARRPQPLGKPGEQLYGSRFIGTRGYLVTFRLTDPLYVIDLADPADPRVAGELQMPGYSDYLFPLGDMLLLGVGKDAIADGSAGDGRFAWYQGVQVALLDVSDPARPREVARSIVGRRGSSATVLYDHHGIALQAVGGTVRVGLPVSVHETPVTGGSGAPADWFGFTRTQLQRFEVDLAAQRLVERPALAASVPGRRWIGDDRSLLWNEQVHWYQNGVWRSAPW